ncbi:hypothetical protein [Cupriavidus pampae]|uniref:EscI/YscI/HrpB family type III secretion system inner rod protein n=1 Tax=Cupriavidus pampae TaxID=659251 RepID=A0ABN7ZIT8_9BURK|nr:hypothetical protein [Cupriavidus pampae]CAG9185908.1 hypothetical protein LMG32289_06155 [Cupriavidus pampae]
MSTLVTPPVESVSAVASNSIATAPMQSDIDSFNDMLTAKATKPEHELVANVLSVARSTSRPPEFVQQLGAPDIVSTLDLQASTQSAARQMVVLAKVLGSAATGINKITSMQ